MNFQSASIRALWTSIVLCGIAGCGSGGSGSTEPGVQSPAASAPSQSATHDSEPELATHDATFQLVEVPPAETGIDFQHVSGNSKEKPFPAANGSGVGALDYDLDGWFDLYFATGRSFPINAAGGSPSNQVYRNLGNWAFENVTAETGLEYHGYSVGIAVADYDGFPDVYVTCFGENQLFQNLGDGTFERVPVAPGGNFSTSAAFLDFDADGLLDLYSCNYGEWSYEKNAFCGNRSRNVRIFCSPHSLKPEPDRLLRNQGDGVFRDVTAESGLDVAVGRAQGVLATDVDADGKIDLFIGNDIHPNFLFMNTGSGQFTNVTEMTGTAYDRHGQMQAGMGVAGADVNQDGKWDLFVTNFENEYHTLYLQSAPDDFHDVSMTHGIAAASKPWVGWGTAFVDFDLDGWKDLIVTNGHVDDNLKEMGRASPYDHPPLVWRNEAGRFRFLGKAVGDYFQQSHPGRGLATVDLDNDGDTDVVVAHQDQHPALLRNDVVSKGKTPRQSLTVRLIGTRYNRDALGSRIVASSAATPRIEQIQGGGSYLSAHDLRVIVSAEEGGTVGLEITWPSGVRTSLVGLNPAQQYDIVESAQADSAPLVFRRPIDFSGETGHD